MKTEGCAHCAGLNEDRLFEGPDLRVVLVHDTGFDGWCRVIWNDHVSELTDLDQSRRRAVLDAVIAVETALRSELDPWKINIASLGTGAPHLHFHIIPRFEDDPTFPDPVWLEPRRPSTRRLPDGFKERIRRQLAAALGADAA